MAFLSLGPGEFHAAHDGAALHGDLGDFGVAGVGEVEQAEVGADAAGVAGERDVPERVGSLGGLLDDIDLGAGGELAEGAGVREDGVLGGVVERVFGEVVGGKVAGVGGGVAELKLLGCSEADAGGGFGAGDVEGGDVDGLPLFAGGEGQQLGVVDGVGLVEAEADGGETEPAVGGRPVGSAFEAPA